jgi:hypothetical protein
LFSNIALLYTPDNLFSSSEQNGYSTTVVLRIFIELYITFDKK